jgi:hypothetical protein
MMRIRGIKHNGELKMLINTPHTLVLREKVGVREEGRVIGVSTGRVGGGCCAGGACAVSFWSLFVYGVHTDLTLELTFSYQC